MQHSLYKSGPNSFALHLRNGITSSFFLTESNVRSLRDELNRGLGEVATVKSPWGGPVKIVDNATLPQPGEAILAWRDTDPKGTVIFVIQPLTETLEQFKEKFTHWAAFG